MDSEVNTFEFPPIRQCNVVIPLDDPNEDFHGAHRHNFFEIIWCLDNKGYQVIDFEKIANKVGRIFTLSPGQVHDTSGDAQSVRMLIFSTDFVDNRYRKQVLLEQFFSSPSARPPFYDVTPEALPYLEPIFMLIHDECLRENPDWDLVESLTISFLLYVLRFSEVNQCFGSREDSRVADLKILVEKNYRQEKRTDFYANQLNITNKRLNELTKQALGKTVSTLVHDRVILEAKRELMFTENSIKHIALSLGYTDPAYFSRFFISHVGKSPSKFRK